MLLFFIAITSFCVLHGVDGSMWYEISAEWDFKHARGIKVVRITACFVIFKKNRFFFSINCTACQSIDYRLCIRNISTNENQSKFEDTTETCHRVFYEHVTKLSYRTLSSVAKHWLFFKKEVYLMFQKIKKIKNSEIIAHVHFSIDIIFVQ